MAMDTTGKVVCPPTAAACGTKEPTEGARMPRKRNTDKDTGADGASALICG